MQGLEADNVTDPWRAYLVTLGWLLREIEVAGLRLQKTHVSVDGARATLHLPMSKTDVGGVGRERTLRCICHIEKLADGQVPGRDVCPVCHLRNHIEWLQGWAGCIQDCERAKHIPLSPTEAGGTLSKAAAVASWRHLASTLNACKTVSGHSARRSGASAVLKTNDECSLSVWNIRKRGSFSCRLNFAATRGLGQTSFVHVIESTCPLGGSRKTKPVVQIRMFFPSVWVMNCLIKSPGLPTI